nr:putative disease resistance protein At3g14460 [Malus domestica]
MFLQTGELCRKGLTKVRELSINGCKELKSSLKNKAGLLRQLTSLDRLKIEGNSPLVEELGKEAEELLQLQILECKLECLELNKCENLLKLPKGLNQLSSRQELRIHECSSLVSFPDVGLPPSLKVIEITDCHSLIYLAKHQIPQNLRRIEISDCKNLLSLVDEEAVGSSPLSSSYSCLEYLKIDGCESLTSLSLSGQLLRTLKHLQIIDCDRLELITEDGFFRDNTNYCLEYIKIWKCQNLKSLPDGLCHLSNLQTLIIRLCGSLVSFSRLSGGKRPSNLREISIRDCDKLEALPEDMHNLNSLEKLKIDYREGLTFPPNLTFLSIKKVKSCKSYWELEWGLHRLPSLRNLWISGEDPDTVSFPPDMVRMETLLPKSLIDLTIEGFPNLKKLSSKGFQFLTSLQSLKLYNCPKLASIPVEGLPPSLEQLLITGCPVLKERCQPGKGRYWHKISHIPSIELNLTDFGVSLFQYGMLHGFGIAVSDAVGLDVGSQVELSEQDSFVEEYDFLALEAEDWANWESGEVD